MSALSDVGTAFPATMITIHPFSDLKGASISAAQCLCVSIYTQIFEKQQPPSESDEFRNGFGHGAAGPFIIQCMCSSVVGIDDGGPGSSIVGGIPTTRSLNIGPTWTADTIPNIDHSGPTQRRGRRYQSIPQARHVSSDQTFGCEGGHSQTPLAVNATISNQSPGSLFFFSRHFYAILRNEAKLPLPLNIEML